LISHLFYLSQTVTTLNLAMNTIGAIGARAISQALEINQVEWIFRFFISINHLFYLSQTLTTLDLTRNQIGDAGARAICRALKTNQVEW